MAKDYYKILGIPREATTIEIRKAYRTLAIKYHPDKSDSPTAAQQFQEINEAYEILSSEKGRKEYDNQGTDSTFSGYNRTSGFHFRSAQDIFREFFAGRDPFVDFFQDDFFLPKFDDWANSTNWNDRSQSESLQNKKKSNIEIFVNQTNTSSKGIKITIYSKTQSKQSTSKLKSESPMVDLTKETTIDMNTKTTGNNFVDLTKDETEQNISNKRKWNETKVRSVKKRKLQ